MLLSRHDLYERCVQDPAALVPFLLALHGSNPRVLAEDFCGSAALSREWLRKVPNAIAHATDIDPEMIAVARQRCSASDLRLTCASVLHAPPTPADVIFAGNFSIGELHSRSDLLRYLALARQRLKPHAIFVCDTYGGESAFRLGAIQRIIPLATNEFDLGPAPSRIRYTWEHRAANPLSALVTNAIHFRVECNGEIIHQLTDAFVYHWRIWSVPELVDALHQVGFSRVEIRDNLDHSSTCSIPSENFAVTLCARNA
jgi:SAM-dependent methyltransferase